MEGLTRTLVGEGILRSQLVMSTFLKVDRREFCHASEISLAYSDMPLGIGYNATISAPHMHAYALEAALPVLQQTSGDVRVLDVGSGSGFLTVCFARLIQALQPSTAFKVIGIEHIEGLAQLGEQNSRKSHADLLSSGCVKFMHGDGRSGYVQEAPYDVIHVGAAASTVPQSVSFTCACFYILVAGATEEWWYHDHTRG